MQVQDSKYKIYKQSIRIQVQLLSKNKQLIISIYDKKDQHSLLFQDQFQFNSFKNESDLFLSNWSIFCQMVKYTFEQQQSKIIFKAEGQLVISYQHHGLGQTFVKNVTFKLKRRIQYQEEVRILREKVNNYQKEMEELKKQVDILKLQNVQILARLSLLEQKSSRKQQTSYVQKERETQAVVNSKKLQEENQKTICNQPQVIKPLIFDIDPQSLYYSKFSIEQSKIKSLIEDYYQVHWKDPLPKKGVSTISFKVCAKNHYSIGLISESQLKNQYSFQNKNSICLYTYFQGGFRGLYIEGDYVVLNDWSIELNEIVEMKINLTEGKLQISMNGRTQAKQVDIKELQKKGEIYFFLQMYEKDNVLQFIKE